MAVALYIPASLSVMRPVPNPNPRPAVRKSMRPRRGGAALVAACLAMAIGGRAFAQTQQMNTVVYNYGPYSVTSDGSGNIFFSSGGYVYLVPAGEGYANVTQLQVSNSGGLYPFTDPVVAVVSDVSGDLFVAVQHPLNSPTNGPYVNIYELTNQPIAFTGTVTSGSAQIYPVSSTTGLVAGDLISGPGLPQGEQISSVGSNYLGLTLAATASGTGVALQASNYTWGGLVYGPSSPPPLSGGVSSTVNSIAYDNLNGFLYVNFYNGNDGQQQITCNNISISFTGNTTASSTTVSGLSSTSGLIVGQLISSADLPAGDHIATVGVETITLTAPATTTATGVGMGVVPNTACSSITEFSGPLNDNYANGLAVDGAGNVYTAYGSTTGHIAQFPPGFSGPGRVYSTGSTGFAGGAVFPGQPGLIGLAADDAGQIFVDAGAEIFAYSPSFDGSGTPNGLFIPVAGTGMNGYNGDNGTATLLQLSYSEGVALDPNGNLWIADTNNGRIREISPAGIGQGEGTASVTGASPSFGCLQCGPQSLGNGTGGVAGYGNQPAPTDTIQTNHFSNLTLLNPASHKLYVAYPNALVVFSTANDTVQTTGSVVDIIPQDITQMALDPATNIIWAINAAGQILEINSGTDQLVSAPFIVVTGAKAQAIAVDSKLNQVYVAYSTMSGITVSYHVAVISGATGTALALLSLSGPAQALVADSQRGVAYLIAQDPYSACPSCPQYDYDILVINGTTANGGTPIEIKSTTTLIEGSAYSSGVTHSSLAVDANTGKVVFADAVDAYFSLYNPAEPSYAATDHVSLGWIPNAVTIDTANSIAYLTDSQYNNVQAVGLATVLYNTAYGWSYNLFSGTQGGNSCGFFANAVVPDPTTGDVYITTCTVSGQTITPVLNQFQYTGVTVSGTTLTPAFTCGYGSATCPPLDSYNLPVSSGQSSFSYEYALNVDTTDHALFVSNGESSNILVFNGPYPPALRPQQALNTNTFSFGNSGLGLTQTQTLTFTNSGGAAMLDPVITISGTNAGDFSFTDGCAAGVPASGGTCSDAIKFTPSILGSESATALVVDNSPDLPQTLTLSGTGVLPASSGTASSSTLLQVSALQVAPSAQLTLYATISPAIPSTGEQVIFLDNTTTPATVLGSGTAAGGSVWTLSTSRLAAGTHALTAYYAGDSTYAPSTSLTVNLVISASGTGPSQPLLSFTPGEFYQPHAGTTSNYSAVAIDSAGDEFALDSGVGSVTEYTVGGTTTVYLPAGSYDQGSLMSHPMGLAVAPNGGTVYIADTQNGRIATSTSAGSSFVTPMQIYGVGACNGGTPTSFATLSGPTGISIGPPATPATVASGSKIVPNSAGYDLYVADSGNKRVLQINPVGGNTSQCGFYPGGVLDAILAGTGSPSGPTLNKPLSVAATGSIGSTTVYIADAPPAITNTSQGNGTIYNNGTAIANTGQIVFPYSLGTDAAGDFYYSDQSLDQVWRIDTEGNFLLQAGNGLSTSTMACTIANPCAATATSVLVPYGLAVSGNGSIFAGDTSGTGQVGEVNVTTGMVNFPSQPTTSTSSAMTVTVTDTAAMQVGASGATIGGTNPTDFAISGGTCNTTSGFTLQPGKSCSILVTFDPGAAGAARERSTSPRKARFTAEPCRRSC